ncbi:MAG: hypothetical protein JW741_27425 [Sedimentisphaerales bacterium]|nr:hypothetical protein [Sedimentisphaerales bacterium]
MFSQTTRLEFIIVAVALLVLLMCSQPPRSGNADIQMPTLTPDLGEGSENPPAPGDSAPQIIERVSELPTETSAPASEISTARQTPRNTFTEPMQVRTVPLRSAAAQNTAAPNNPKTPSEEVAVRYVWDGTKLVPQKVRIVDEGNGVRSIYSFDQ